MIVALSIVTLSCRSDRHSDVVLEPPRAAVLLVKLSWTRLEYPKQPGDQRVRPAAGQAFHNRSPFPEAVSLARLQSRPPNATNFEVYLDGFSERDYRTLLSFEETQKNTALTRSIIEKFCDERST